MPNDKTLILLFHPDFTKSKANRALAAAATELPDVELIDMQALYPDGRIDVAVEVQRLIQAERIVLQFPVQWYSTPPLLKAWQDSVLTRMFYIAYETEGQRIKGRPLLVAATAGNVPAAYTADGMNLFALSDLLRPLHSTAHRCGLLWSEPFLVHSANKLEPAALADAAAAYAARLQEWVAGVPGPSVTADLA